MEQIILKANINECTVENWHSNAGEVNARVMNVELCEDLRSCGKQFVTFELEDGTVYESLVVDGKAELPIFEESQFIKIGVYAENINGDECEKRYSAHPANHYVNSGSFKNKADEQPKPTPGDYSELLEKIEGVDGSGGVVDQKFNPESKNAQSGIAVAQALEEINLGQGSLKEVERPNVWELESGAYLVKGGFYWATPRPPVFQSFKEATNCFLLVSVDQYKNNQRKYYAIIDNDVYYGFSCENGINVDTGEHIAEGECNKQIVTTVEPSEGHTNEQVYGAKALDETFVAIDEMLQEKQAELVSGTNIKTINGQSILGSGNLSITGGGSTDEEWEHICDVSVVEDTENPITKITQDLGASYKKLHILINKNSPGGLVTSGGDSYPLRIFANIHHNNNLVGVFGAAVTSSGWCKYSCEIDYNAVSRIITGWSSIGFTTHFKQVTVEFESAINKLIFVNTPHATTGGGFKTFTINIYGVRE